MHCLVVSSKSALLPAILKVLSSDNAITNSNTCVLMRELLSADSHELDLLYSPDSLRLIVDQIAKEPVCYLNTLIALIKARPNNPALRSILDEVLPSLISQLKNRHSLPEIMTTYGVKQTLLGSHNLKIIELIVLCVPL